MLVDGTGEVDYFFWVFWRPNMTNGRPPLSHGTGTPTQKNPKHGYLNIEKGSITIFLDFEALFWRVSWQNRGTGLFFLGSLTSKHDKWPPSIVSQHWHTHAKKSPTWVLEHWKRAGRLYVVLRVCSWCIPLLVTCLGRCHEWVRYAKKPLHVIRRYLPRY